MRGAGVAAGRALGIALFCGWPLAIYAAREAENGTQVASVLSSLEVLALILALLWRSRHRLKWAVAAVLLAGLWAFRAGFAANPVAPSGIPHAAAYLGLLIAFALSLRPGREPVVTALARHMRGAISPRMLAYTRGVTWAWCLFFAGQLAGSLLLFWFASVTAWSLFVNVLNLPLVALMFAAEYGVRRLQFRGEAHPTFLAVIRACTGDTVADA